MNRKLQDAHKWHQSQTELSSLHLPKIYRKKKKKTPVTSNEEQKFSTVKKVKRHLLDFCDNFSIPGLKYLTEPNRPIHERVLWLVGIALSIVACVYLIREAWERWVSSPVIVTMDENLRAVWQIPFPAVTICPLARINLNKFNFTDTWERSTYTNITPTETRYLEYLSLQCHTYFGNRTLGDDNEAINVIEEFSLPLEEQIQQGLFRNIDFDSYEKFQPIMTSNGLCHSMNMLPNDIFFRKKTFHESRNYLDYNLTNTVTWTVDGGYSPSSGTKEYPVRALAAGIDGGLLLILGTKPENKENFCSKSMHGFQVLLHSPADFPVVQHQSFMVPLDCAVDVAVKPREVITSETLRVNYSPEQRKCYFSQERYLRFFKIYTRSNCEIECLANVTLAHCGCVAFYMPRMQSTRICGVKEHDCLDSAVVLFQLVESGVVGEEIDQEEKEKIQRKFAPCDCKQSCAAISYETARSLVPTNVDDFLKIYYTLTGEENPYINSSKSHWIIMQIYYEESHFIPNRRMELYGVTTFIANFGGVLGLCLGMSFLSTIELLYWLMIRPFWRSTKIAESGPPKPMACFPSELRKRTELLY